MNNKLKPMICTTYSTILLYVLLYLQLETTRLFKNK